MRDPLAAWRDIGSGDLSGPERSGQEPCNGHEGEAHVVLRGVNESKKVIDATMQPRGRPSYPQRRG